MANQDSTVIQARNGMSESQPGPEMSPGITPGGLLDVQTNDPMRVHRGRLVNMVLLGAIGASLVWLVVLAVVVLGGGAEAAPGMLVMWALTVIVLGVTYALNRRSASPLAGLVLALATLAGVILVLNESGPLTVNVIGLTVPVIVAGLLGPPTSAFLLATLGTVVFAWLNVQRDPTYPLQVMQGGSGLWVVLLDLYILAALGWLFSRMAGRAIRQSHSEVQALLAQQAELESRLDRRKHGLQAAAEVARALADLRGTEDMLRDIVRLVREYFGYESAGLYLIDDARANAVLRAHSSVERKTSPLPGHNVPLGAVNVVARAAQSTTPVLAGQDADTGGEPGRRSEVAVPMLVGDEPVGVLALQSASLDLEDIPALQALADQLAVAIANARKYDETQRNLRELNELSRVQTLRGWQEYLFGKAQKDLAFDFGPTNKAREKRQAAIVQQVLATADVVSVSSGSKDAPGQLAAPLLLRDQVVGVVGVEAEEPRSWTNHDVQLLKSIAGRAALAVENVRLMERIESGTGREQLVNAIAARLQRAQDLRGLLVGAAEELGAALGTDQVYAEFSLQSAEDDKAATGRLRPTLNGDGSPERADVEDERRESG